MNKPSPPRRQANTACSFMTSRVNAAAGQAATTSSDARRSSVVLTPQDGEAPIPTMPATAMPERW